MFAHWATKSLTLKRSRANARTDHKGNRARGQWSEMPSRVWLCPVEHGGLVLSRVCVCKSGQLAGRGGRPASASPLKQRAQGCLYGRISKSKVKFSHSV